MALDELLAVYRSSPPALRSVAVAPVVCEIQRQGLRRDALLEADYLQIYEARERESQASELRAGDQNLADAAIGASRCSSCPGPVDWEFLMSGLVQLGCCQGGRPCLYAVRV